jgi:hypothetical protein
MNSEKTRLGCFLLGRCLRLPWWAVPQRLVFFSRHPQPVPQNRPLARQRRIVRSVTPIISAASHHFSFPAIARKITSCTFIVRSITAWLYCPSLLSTAITFSHPAFSHKADKPPVNSTGQTTY